MLSYFRTPVALEDRSIRSAMKLASAYARGLTVDVGCGLKPYQDVFAGRITAYLGVDIDPPTATAADVCGDSLALPIKSAIADTVVSNQTIEHVRSPERFMSEVARILKPKGVAIITAPFVWCLHRKPEDYYRFTRYALEHLCRESGLEVLELRERHGAYAAIGQMLSLMIHLQQKDVKWKVMAGKLMTVPIQAFFHFLDVIFYTPDLTLGYILVARKKGEP